MPSVLEKLPAEHYFVQKSGKILDKRMLEHYFVREVADMLDKI